MRWETYEHKKVEHWAGAKSMIRRGGENVGFGFE